MHLIDKVNNKLAGWKLNSLSRAARLLLIKSTLLAIPIYYMQIVTILPETVNIEGLCHKFFWSSSRERRKLHTVAWAKICRPLSMGGLGMLNLRDMNSMLLSKQLWKLVHDPESLGSSILQRKYGG